MDFSINNKSAAIFLHFFNSVIQASTFIYVNTLFLSSYPVSWLPYFFIGQTCIDLLASYFLSPLLSANTQKRSLVITLILTGITIAFLVFFKTPLYILPLLFCFFLMTTSSLINSISWNSVRIAFDVMEFKELSSDISTANALGDILISILIAFLLRKYTYQFIPAWIVIGLIVISILLTRLLPLPQPIVKVDKKSVPVQYPLFKKLFIAGTLIAFSNTIVDYCLRYQIGVDLKIADLGEFMAIFNSVCGVISLIFSYFTIKRFVNLLGVTSLLFILPMYSFITSFTATLYPILSLIIIMAAGKFIFYYRTFVTGRELVLNVLPMNARNTAQFIIKSISGPLGEGLASLLLFFFAIKLSIPTWAFIVLLSSGVLLIFMRKIRLNYLSTLKNAIHLKRFDISDLSSEQNREIIRQMALQSLTSHEYESIVFGFTLLSHLNLSLLPNEVIIHLESPYPDIRIQAIRYIKYYQSKSGVPVFIKHLKTEESPSVLWEILDALGTIDPQKGIAYARDHLHDSQPEIQAGAIRILLAGGNLHDEIRALQTLEKMLENSNVEIRRNGARLLRYIPIGNLHKLLERLIKDTDNTVSRYAIEATGILKIDTLLPELIHRLLQGGVFYEVNKVIAQFQKSATPLLIQKVLELKFTDPAKLNPIIKMIASLPESDAENQLIGLAKEKQTLIYFQIAKELMHRAERYPISPENKSQIYHEIQYTFTWFVGLNELKDFYKKEPIITGEIDARLLLLKQILLYWFTIESNSKEVKPLIAIILSLNKIEKAKALEFLISTLKSEIYTHILMHVFLDIPYAFAKTTSFSPQQYIDPWLEKVINSSDNKENTRMMDTMQKVFALRATDLFKQLPGEILWVIAEEAEVIEMSSGEIIFHEGDPPTGLYTIVSGSVDISNKNSIINTLTHPQFFGELALLDNATRSATVIAKSEGVLLFLEKETFNRITDEFPDVLRAVVQVIIHYLRTYIKHSG